MSDRCQHVWLPRERDDEPQRCKHCGITFRDAVRGFGSNVAPRPRKPRTIKSLSG